MAVKKENVKRKITGRAFYESIGSPKVVLAPMVDQSEFAWRMLTRSFVNADSDNNTLLSYSPMLHSRLFSERQPYRQQNFEPIHKPLSAAHLQPKEENADVNVNQITRIDDPNEDYYLDGNPSLDRPLFVQFCSNSPDDLLGAARIVQPYCDAVDLNLGCPQGIAKRGHYGAFLQEDWDLVYSLINRLHNELSIPVTAKMRILETKEKTLDYAKMILSAGASIITVHGRRREQKGHLTGLADWQVIRYLRENLPKETVLFANGNILQHDDIERCLQATGADAVMSAEGNLSDPGILAPPPRAGCEEREYWRGPNGISGWRIDAVFRRYLDIIHRHVLGREPPVRTPLFVPDELSLKGNMIDGSKTDAIDARASNDGERPAKRQKKENTKQPQSINLKAMQAHSFNLLKPLITQHTDIRDMLAKCRSADVEAFEEVLTRVEEVTKIGLLKYAKHESQLESDLQEPQRGIPVQVSPAEVVDSTESSEGARQRCKRPWFICQPYIRPLPKEALEKGAIQLSKKDKQRLELQNVSDKEWVVVNSGEPEPHTERVSASSDQDQKLEGSEAVSENNTVDIPKQGMVCG